MTRRYSVDKRFSSFVGFAPADAPRIVIGVFIDEPHGEVYGGELAAPVFREVAEHALKSLGVPPTLAAAPPPPVAARREDGGRLDPVGKGRSSPEQVPDLPVFEEAPGRSDDETRVAVPLVAGLPVRSALRALEQADLAADVRGTGRVVAQTPAAGQVVERGARIRLVLAPPRS